jgi:hypothetical protein
MQPQSNNPLAKHFRQPAIYLTLPSNGAYWPDGSLELTMNNQVAVYPMTTRDEIMLRTPDALLNGESVVQVIQSCCPQIKDAWKMPSIDVDAVLIGIRVASYGEGMDIDSFCPNEECKHENTHQLDLTTILDAIHTPNYNQLVEVQGLKIKLKPQTYFEGNKANMANFEEQQLLSVINDDSLDDAAKRVKFKEHMDRMINVNLEVLTSGTEYIETNEGEKLYQSAFIKEFYDMSDNKVLTAVRKQFEIFAEAAALPKSNVICEECQNSYPVAVTFDYTRFFVNAS